MKKKKCDNGFSLLFLLLLSGSSAYDDNYVYERDYDDYGICMSSVPWVPENQLTEWQAGQFEMYFHNSYRYVQGPPPPADQISVVGAQKNIEKKSKMKSCRGQHLHTASFH